MICFRSGCKRLCYFVAKRNEMNCLTTAAVLLVSRKPVRAGRSVCMRSVNQMNQSDKCSEGGSTEKEKSESLGTLNPLKEHSISLGEEMLMRREKSSLADFFFFCLNKLNKQILFVFHE